VGGSGDAEVKASAGPAISIHSSTRANTSKQAAETTAQTDAPALSNFFLDQTGVNLLTTASSNDVVSDGHLTSGDGAANRTNASIFVPLAPLAAPTGTLAFALRLKSSDAADPNGAGAGRPGNLDADSQIDNTAHALLPSDGSRLLDAIVKGSSDVSNSTSNEALNIRASVSQPQVSSTSSFVTQLTALTSSLSGQGRVPPVSDTGTPSDTNSGNRDSASAESPGASTNLGLANVRLSKASPGSSAATPQALEGAVRPDGPQNPGLFTGAQTQMAGGPSQPSTAAGTASAAAANLPEKDVPLGNEPVRNIRVQLSGEGSQHIDMRFVERDGALSVSVRSTDETLTRSLQENLSELNTRLVSQHFQTETWTPGRSASTDSGANEGSGNGSESGSSGSGGSKQGRSSPDERSGSQGHSGQSQDGRRDNRPVWVRHLAALDEVPRMTPGERSQIGN
jgi:hypothetical protein